MAHPLHSKKPEGIEGRPNGGKDYADYLKEDADRNGAIRSARMQAAIAAKKAREAAGIDISVHHNDITVII